MNRRGPMLLPPPVYRRLLHGDATTLRLERADVWALLLMASAFWLVRAVAEVLAGGSLGAMPLSWFASLTVAAATAGFAARWLGRRPAVLGGAVLLVIHVTDPGVDCLDLFSSATVVAAIAAFSWANVPGHCRLGEIGSARLAFAAAAALGFMLAGPIVPASVAVACLMYLVIGQDKHGMRFLVDPVVFVVFSLAAVVSLIALATPACPPWLAAWQQHWPQLGWFSDHGPGTAPGSIGPAALAGSLLLWVPALAVAFVAGIRRGYFSTPIWRMTACWLAGAAVVAAMSDRPWPAALAPPVAILAAAGILEAAAWFRRGRLRWSAWKWSSG